MCIGSWFEYPEFHEGADPQHDHDHVLRKSVESQIISPHAEAHAFMLNSMMMTTPIFQMSGSHPMDALLETTNVASNPFYIIALDFRTLKRLLRGSNVVA
jgi:hypothetical protein